MVKGSQDSTLVQGSVYFLDFFSLTALNREDKLSRSPKKSKDSTHTFSTWGQVSALAAPVLPYLITWIPTPTPTPLGHLPRHVFLLEATTLQICQFWGSSKGSLRS